MNKKAFTLPELIVVVTILVILGSIAYVSFSGYSKSARDTKRNADLKKLELGLAIFSTKSSKLPFPSDKVDITSNGEVIMYQGYAGVDVLRKIGANKKFKDPLEDTFYTYSISRNHRNFEVMGFLENGVAEYGLKSFSANAKDFSSRSPKVYGDKLGILLQENTKIPIQDLGISVDISTTTDNYIAVLDNTEEGFITGGNSELEVIHPKYDCDRLKQLSKNILKNGTYNTYIDSSAECNFDEESIPAPVATIKTSCLDHLNDGETTDGIYTITLNGSDHNVYCDMTTSGGGWTLIINRKQGGNNTACGKTNLGEFIDDGCGNSATISQSDDYSIGSTLRPQINFTEYLFSKHRDGTIDSDDSYIVHHSGDLFSFLSGQLLDVPVSQVCDIDNNNCDTIGNIFRYGADGYFRYGRCNAIFSSNYRGAYGLCHNQLGTNYNMDSLFGNRSRWNEVKLWGYTGGSADSYQDLIFVR